MAEPPSEDRGGQPPATRRPSSEPASEIDSSRVLSEKVWNLPIRGLSTEFTPGVEDTRLYFSSRVLRSWRNWEDPPHEAAEEEDALEDEDEGGSSMDISVLFWNVESVTGLFSGSG